MFRKAFITIVFLIVIIPVSAQTLEGPSVDEIRQKYALELPPHWKVNTFNIEASANYGTPVEPIIKSRFVSTVVQDVDTFVKTGSEDPFTFLQLVSKAGETRTVYGISTSVLKAGAWPTEFELENALMEDVDKPRDFFRSPTIVRGTKEETDFHAQLEAEEAKQHQLELARRAREEDLKEQERKAALAQTVHEGKLREEKRKEQEKAELARVEFEAKLQEEKQKQKEKEEADSKARVLEIQSKLENDVKTEFRMKVPGYWDIIGFTVDVATNVGTISEPIFKHHFKAEVHLNTDTFFLFEKKGAYVFVTPVESAGEKRVVYGVSTAQQSNGSWKIDLKLDNDFVLQEIGKSRDYFLGKVIVKGSSEEAEYWKQVEAESWNQVDAESKMKHKAELSRRAKEEELKEQKRKAELAQITHEINLKEEKNKAELARMEFEAKLQEEKQKQKEKEEATSKARVLEIQSKLENDIKTEFRMKVPGYWDIIGFTVDVATNVGTISDSVFKHHFKAEVQLNTNTFVLAEKKEAYVFVTPVESAGEKRIVYGVSTAQQSNGNWEIDFKLDNDFVLQDIGKSRDYFLGKVIVKGSSEEVEYWKQVEAESEMKHKAELSRQAKEEELKEQKRKAELARLTREEKLIEEKRKAEIAKLESEAQLREAKKRQLEKEEAQTKANAERRLAELDTALKTGDSNKKRIALLRALEGPDIALRTKALHYIISQTKTLSGVIDKKKRIPFSLQIKNFNSETGEISGEYHGNHYVFTHGQQGFRGKVSGVNLGVAAKTCSISITLGKSALMEGTIDCWRDFRSEYVAIGIF